MLCRLRQAAVTCLLLVSPLGCGWINTGGGAWGNDPRPDGVVLSAGNLTSQNGASISGSVIVYRSNQNGQLILRLESLRMDAPKEAAYRMVAEVNGGTNFTTNLAVFSGNTNYSTGLQAPATIARVIIESAIRIPPELATATLTPVQ